MKNTDQLIGTVQGPGEKSNQYCFVTTTNTATKIGEFVYYTTLDNKQIIGTITEKAIIRTLPESYLSDPTINPHDISNLLGCDLCDTELYQITVSINGYFDPKMNCFINPRLAPSPGDKIYLVSDKTLSEVINSKKLTEIGAAHIGSLLTRDQNSVPVILNVKNLVSTHLTILASTGSGKSYTAGVLIEELMKPNNRSAVLIVDPHNEYDTLKAIENHPLFQKEGYKPRVNICPPHKIKVRYSSLSENDIKYLLPNLSDKMSYYLTLAYKKISKGADPEDDRSHQWNLSDLLQQLNILEEEREEDSGTINALRWRLEHRLENSKVFTNSEHLSLNKIFSPGQCTVLQLSEIDQTEQQIIVSTILRRINKARMDTHKGYNSNTESESYIPYPVFILLEEAHRFAPANAPSVSLNILKTILSEGRKFGVGIGLITQRPGKLDSDVLSQCMTQLIMKIINPVDQSTIASSIESAGKQLLDELASLSRGQVIVSGASTNIPVLTGIRERITSHGGETIDAPECWKDYFNSDKEKTRKIESSKLIKTDRTEKIKGFSI
jgi:DNA helicase HerA-like ATPase